MPSLRPARMIGARPTVRGSPSNLFTWKDRIHLLPSHSPFHLAASVHKWGLPQINLECCRFNYKFSNEFNVLILRSTLRSSRGLVYKSIAEISYLLHSCKIAQ